MPAHDALLTSLREALALSPGNVPLRVHLAELLLRQEDFSSAEKEFRAALAQAPADEGAKLGLAEAFFRQGKGSAALVILEGWMAQGDAPASARLWAARVHAAEGEMEEARRRYREALDRDPSLADPALDRRLQDSASMGAGAGSAPAGPSQPDHPSAGGAEGEKVRVPARAADAATDGPAAVEKPAVAFADVGGMDRVKEEIRVKIIHPMAHPEIYKAYGKAIGGGILLYGPPGCGKTHLARATAGEVKSYFLSVGIHDVLDMYLGQSESNLHDIFQLARANTPCVLFFDEVDALAMNRADMRQSAGRQVINQFLSELDGVGASNEGVLVLAATNAPWHLDSAFRRPGRFDRMLFVPPPDADARAAIFAICLKGRPAEEGLDLGKLAKATEGFSGADIKAVVDIAVEARLGEAIRAGRPAPITQKDLLGAAKAVKPSTREWFSTARNYALYANQGGIYDDILSYFKP
jgi:SpoVK/Ycf46/Vps4 family AAA+-type ATPase